MDSETVQAVGVIAAAMVAMLGMLWGVMALVTKTVMQQVRQWQQDMQKTLDGVTADIAQVKAGIAEFRTEVRAEITEVKADIAALRTEVKADIAALRTEVKADIADVNARLDRQGDQILDVRNQVATLSERMARVEERIGIPAEPIVTA